MARILIIEDDPTLQEAYSFVLNMAGHHIDAAYNGKEGLAHVKKNAYQLILLDLNMPVMNGWEFLEAYQHEKKRTKVILFSNMVEAEMTDQAKKLGVHKCVLKSAMTPSEMLALVKKETA